MNHSPLKALVVGRGSAAHAAPFLERDDVDVIGVVGAGSERTAALARAYSLPVFMTLDAALEVAAPDIAVVALNASSNVLLHERLLDIGCDILCAHPVATTPAAVRSLDAFARARGRIVSTDYLLHACDELRATQGELPQAGALMRLVVTYPGRLIDMAIDLACRLGGRIASVMALGGYPIALAERRMRTPALYPPMLLFEHVAGCITSLVPCPHGGGRDAISVTASYAELRLELRLPSGGAYRVRLLGGGGTERTELVRPSDAHAKSAWAAVIRRQADDFVNAVLLRVAPPCPLSRDATVRTISQAVAESSRQGERVSMRAWAGWE